MVSMVSIEKAERMSSSRHIRSIGSGTVVVLGIVGAAAALLALGRVVGWDPTWRAMGVTPLQPPFFDMHVINDYAACAWKGVDAYAPHACNVDNFNIPPTWLLVGFLGVDGSDASWLSAAVIAASIIVMVIASGALLVSRSGCAGRYERRIGRACGAIAFLGFGVTL